MGDRGNYEERIQAEKMAALAILSERMAHDINNAVMGVMLFVESLKLEKDIKGDVRETLFQIEKGLKRIADIVYSLKVLTQKEEAFLEKVDINDVVKKVIPLVSQEFGTQAINLIEDYGEKLPGVAVSINMMQRVFMNVLLNARDAVWDKGVKEVAISTCLEDNIVKIKIKDNGCGIKQEDVQKVFNPFFTTKPSKRGLGLGLYIVKTIMDKHTGRIEIRSDEQKGTEFVLCLPVPS